MEHKDRDFASEHRRKMIAPTVISILLGAYYIAIGAVCLCIPEIPIAVKLFLAAIPAALTGVLVFVFIERIKEIRSGEEDDLSQY